MALKTLVKGKWYQVVKTTSGKYYYMKDGKRINFTISKAAKRVSKRVFG